MVSQEIQQIKEAFSFLSNRVLAVLLFGSQANNESHGRSDYDICIVAPNQDSYKIIKEVWRRIDVHGKKYDVWTFEELPLYMKMAVIKNHRILFVKDKGALYEHFYFYRKLWKDQAHRQAVIV